MNGLQIINLALAKTMMNLSYNSPHVLICLKDIMKMTNAESEEEVRRCLMADTKLFGEVVANCFEDDRDYLVFESEKQVEFAEKTLKVQHQERGDGSKFAVCLVGDAVRKIESICRENEEFGEEKSDLIADVLTLPVNAADRVKKREIILRLAEC